MKIQKISRLPIFYITILGMLLYGCNRAQPATPTPSVGNDPLGNGVFNGENAYNLIKTQLTFGPRIPGSNGQKLFVEWVNKTLSTDGWDTTTQSTNIYGIDITNIIATRGTGSPSILLGAHYDTRMKASRDENTDDQVKPVPGANDGASGVAVLLEIARALPRDYPCTVTLAFFDAEDQGGINDLPWIIGSNYYVNNLQNSIDKVIIVDMVGDENLVIYQEQNSDLELTNSIWTKALELGYGSNFVHSKKYNILDDHIPFIQAGIPSVLIIDMEYPYWHTTLDNLEHVSPTSLSIVGKTILAWLISL